MSFLDNLDLSDIVKWGAPIAGGVGGFLLGGPGGALAGAGLGGKLGSILTSGDDAESAMLDKYSGAWDPMKNPEYAAQIAKLKEYSSGKLNDEDKQRMAEALDTVNQHSKGERGAIEQRGRMHGGGPNVGLEAALEAEGASAGSQRLSRSTSAAAAMAAERGRAANLELLRQLGTLSTMQQQFALLKSGAAGSQQAAKNANMNALYGDLANFGVGQMMKAKDPLKKPMSADVTSPNRAPAGDPLAGSWDPTGDSNMHGGQSTYGGDQYSFLDTLGAPTAADAAKDYAFDYVQPNRTVQIPKFSRVSYGQ